MASIQEIKLYENWKWLDYKPDKFYVPCTYKESF